jgi:hypothetical protein
MHIKLYNHQFVCCGGTTRLRAGKLFTRQGHRQQATVLSTSTRPRGGEDLVDKGTRRLYDDDLNGGNARQPPALYGACDVEGDDVDVDVSQYTDPT